MYSKGLFASPKGRANCLYMGDHLEDCDSQSINHMLSNSPWSYQSLFDRIFEYSLKLIKAQKSPIYLLIDEVGFRKKGRHSACVGKQYLGCIGKHDNGQVAVSAALSSGNFYVPVGMELFMPKDWSTDAKRREKAGIPNSVKALTKPGIALNMILKMAPKIKALEFVVFDALYGSSTEFLSTLMQAKVPFIAEVRENITFYLQEPRLIIPVKKNGEKGRKFIHPKPNQKSTSARNYITKLEDMDFQSLQVRNGTKGPVQGNYHRRKIWLHCKHTQQFLPIYLLVRSNKDGSHKYSMCYHPQTSSIKQMAVAQAQRVFVERVFEEGKNIAGMGDYQVRSWEGFHKHMAICGLTLLYIMEQKIKNKEAKVTAYDIQRLVNTTIKFITNMNLIYDHIRKKNRPLNPTMARNRNKG